MEGSSDWFASLFRVFVRNYGWTNDEYDWFESTFCPEPSLEMSHSEKTRIEIALDQKWFKPLTFC
jgi:hypothetical protein